MSSAVPPQNILEALKKLAPFLSQMKQQQQPQGGGGTPPAPGMAPQMPSPPTLGQPAQGGLDIKADPRAQVGSLPMPVEQPQRQATEYQPYRGAYALTPKNQGVYDAVQGVTGFVTKWAQKQDQAKHAEAANAAQQLMQAIDSKDFVAANDILHQNEKLFNKVYKGWLQKSEKAQEPQKQEKVDPDVQGFETGLQSYLQGRSQTAPQPPRTLGASKSAPGGYYLPRATPGQQAQGQQASSMNQALQQQPSMGVPGGYVPPAEQAKLDIEREKVRGEFQKTFSDLQKANVEYQTKQVEFHKAQQEAQAAASKGATEQETAKSVAARAASAATEAATNLDIKKTELQIQQLKLQGVKTGSKDAKVPASYQAKFAALTQAQQLLKTVDTKKGFAPDQFMQMQNLLNSAGMPSYSKSLMTPWYKGIVGMTNADPASISETLDRQKQALVSAFPGLAPKEEASDDSDPDAGDSTDDDDPLGYFKSK